MSFTSDVKAELCSAQPVCDSCLAAEAQGMLLPCLELTARRLRLVTESADAAKRLALLTEALCGVEVELSLHGSESYLVLVEEAEAVLRILNALDLPLSALALRIGRATLERECCIHAFLRGFFLSSGTVADPEKGYRLELVTRHRQLCDDLETLLQEQGFSPIRTTRRSQQVLCLKSADAVSDLLQLMSAGQAVERVAQARKHRAIKNAVNRQNNSSLANLNRSATANALQNEALQRLEQRGQLEQLPDSVRAVALLRLAHPEATLSELAELSNGISRSTIARHLNKLVELAEK